jgi:hypothetical protein
MNIIFVIMGFVVGAGVLNGANDALQQGNIPLAIGLIVIGGAIIFAACKSLLSSSHEP